MDTESLFTLLKKKIKDPLILTLIRGGLKNKVFGQNSDLTFNIFGNDTDSLGSLLFNLYLNVFDRYIKKKLGNYKDFLPFADNVKSFPFNFSSLGLPNKRRFIIKYIRYGGTFLIGLNFPLKIACEFKKQLTTFLHVNLKLANAAIKTKIIPISKGVKFLGHIFSPIICRKKKDNLGEPFHRKRRIALKIDSRDAISILKIQKFCDGSGFPLPCFQYLTLPQSETNLRVNTLIKRLSNLWVLACNRRKMIFYAASIIRHSVAKLYAAKFKMGTVSKVFKIAKLDLSIAIGNTKKSAIGNIDSKDKKIHGILYDKFFKVPFGDEGTLFS